MSSSGSGIYAIVNLTNGDRYVGSASHLQQRKSAHLTGLRNNKHGNAHLQSAWNKYGEENFEFVILEHVAKEFLLDVEQRYLDTTRREYNIATVAWAPNLGKPLSAETRAKQSAALKGRVCPQERRLRTSATLMGHAVSEETRAKIRAATRGKKKSGARSQKQKEWAAKRGGWNKGICASDKTRAKMTASQKKRWADRKQKAVQA
jgi:group I intron endonuclease